MLSFVNATEGVAREIEEVIWIGASEDSLEELANARRTKEESRFTLIPISIPEKVDQPFYGGFCNDLVWPLFHYFPSISNFEEKNWVAYKHANEIFRDAVRTIAQPGDRVWIHDYHFMLMPAMLREALPNLAIGFFLHIPFPSFEVIRQIPRSWLTELLQGILGANLVGFHTYDYVQYFNNSVQRALGCNVHGGWVHGPNQKTRVEAFPIGIDATSFRLEITKKRTEREKTKIRAAIGEKTMMFSVDRLDYSKGLIHRIEAVELFFREHADWRGKVVFNMVVIPSRENVVRYLKLRKELEANVGRVNGLFSTLDWRPIIYQYRTLTKAEMVALYDVADIGLITPIRDGMNLVAKEFVACQPEETPGILVLSEMAGAASELREALLINPNDKREIATAIRKALEMPMEERKERWARLRDRVFAYDVFTWAQDFLQTLEQAGDASNRSSSESMGEQALGKIRAAYATATTRTLFLDYDGTLVPFQKDPQSAAPTPQLLDVLNRLSADSRNQVCIISGRDRAFLDQWLGGHALTLVAEHGAFIRKAGSTWETTWESAPDWGNLVRRRMQRACKRCLGSTLEEKSTALVWHYRNAETMQGIRVAQELHEELTGLLASDQYLVVPGNRIIEVRPRGFDKGQAARSLLSGVNPGFIMAIGDDRTDEDLFAAMPKGAFPIKVGIGETKARYHLKDASEVQLLLSDLSNMHFS